jgi:hypothetical protein
MNRAPICSLSLSLRLLSLSRSLGLLSLLPRPSAATSSSPPCPYLICPDLQPHSAPARSPGASGPELLVPWRAPHGPRLPASSSRTAPPGELLADRAPGELQSTAPLGGRAPLLLRRSSSLAPPGRPRLPVELCQRAPLRVPVACTARHLASPSSASAATPLPHLLPRRRPWRADPPPLASASWLALLPAGWSGSWPGSLGAAMPLRPVARPVHPSPRRHDRTDVKHVKPATGWAHVIFIFLF